MVGGGSLTANRLARFRTLPPSDRRLFVLAVPAVAVVRLALVVAPVRRVGELIARVTRPASSRPSPTPGEADRVGWAVTSAARFVPGATCLTQALVAEGLLLRRGHPAALRLGVARDDGGRVEAHAWVESYGRVVIGDHDLQRFTELRPSVRATDDP